MCSTYSKEGLPETGPLCGLAWYRRVTTSTPEELYGDIKHAYDEELIEPGFIGLDDIDETLQRGKERVLDALHHNQRYSLITDTITGVEWWACFHPEGREVPPIVSVGQPRVQHTQQKAKDKRKRKLAKAARRRNRR